MPRLFVGTFIEESHRKLLSDVKEANRDLDARWERKLRWVNADKLHLTWFFIGDVPREKMPEVEEKLGAAIERAKKSLASGSGSGLASFLIEFESPELWPNPKKARQLVLRAKYVPSFAALLADEVMRALDSFAAKDAKRYETFKPHITLLRLEAPGTKTVCRPDSQDVKVLPERLPIKLDVRHVSLIESDFGRANNYVSLKDFVIGAD